MKRPTITTVLPLEEWDFSSCLEDERDTCVHYEYAREYVRERPNLAQRLTGPNRAKLARRLLVSQHSKHQPRSYILPILCEHFPGTPWLKVPRQERQDLIEMCSPRTGEGPNPDLLTDAKWELKCLQNFDEMRQRQLEEWKRQGEQWAKTNGIVDGKRVSFAELLAGIRPVLLTPRHYYAYAGHINYAVITLDWSQSNNHLKAAFERLLKRRPEVYPDGDQSGEGRGNSNKLIAAEPRGGRGGAHDRFNQLGALRLLKYHTDPETVVDVLRESDFILPYTKATTVRVAARKARATLAMMEKEGQFSDFSDRL